MADEKKNVSKDQRANTQHTNHELLREHINICLIFVPSFVCYITCLMIFFYVHYKSWLNNYLTVKCNVRCLLSVYLKTF